MNYALIHIGTESSRLNTSGLEVAKNIGRVEIDYGEATCKVPDAMENLTSIKSRLI